MYLDILMEEHSELTIFPNFCKELQTQFGHPIHSLCSDNAKK